MYYVPLNGTSKSQLQSMNSKIETIAAKKLVGMKITTSISNFGSPQLWQKFMPRRNEIQHRLGSQYYSLQIYPTDFKMEDFIPHTNFEYWAAVEVDNYKIIPDEMESLDLIGGTYAIFIHKGPMNTFQETLSKIHTKWLPNSEYTLDNRPHFELLGEKYLGPNDPNSEEEVWVPIRKG